MTIKKVFQNNDNTILMLFSKWITILIGVNMLVLICTKYIKIHFINELVLLLMFLMICLVVTLLIIKTDIKHFQSQLIFNQDTDLIELIKPNREKEEIPFKEVKKIKIIVSEFRGEYRRTLRPSEGINVISIYTLSKNYHSTFILSSEKEYSIIKLFSKKERALNIKVIRFAPFF